MIISHNMMAMNAMRQFNIVTDRKQKNTEKLSSGYRINRAADDAAGLAISEKMRRQIRGLTQASSNVQEGIGFVQVADGALDEIDDMLQRINELAVKAANDTLSDKDREYVDSEVQQIKDEMDRVFENTTFNDRLIWDPEAPDKKVVDYEKTQALTVYRNKEYFDIDNENSGTVPKSGYITVVADSTGVGFSWTGYNNVSYSTAKMSWADFEAQNYSVKGSDLYNGDSKYYKSDGATPLIDFTYRINPIEDATYTDIQNAINGTLISVSSSSPIHARFEDSSGNEVASSGVSVSRASINYSEAYRSQIQGGADGYSFDKGVDSMIEPSSPYGNMTEVPTYSDVTTAKSDSTGFTFEYNMPGIGTVTAKMYEISYSSSDRSDDAEGIWWRYYKSANGNISKLGYSYNAPAATLAGMMSILTTENGTPGLLTSANGGNCSAGGTATMSFNLKSGATVIGSITMGISISNSDTEQTVLDKIKASFNSSTVLDLYTTDADEKGYSGSTYPNKERTYKIDTPIYQATNTLQIQAGSEAGQYITINYDALSTRFLKLNNTRVDTTDKAADAIEEIKAAMQMVNAQRADFGAYQNRLEHTYKNLDNVVENTTAAESQIRDTDMAAAMVQQSLENILEQAGISMIAQANQTKQGVMTLLG